MEIIEINLSDLKISIGNVKEHPEWHIEQIKKSIKEFGFNDPLAIDEDNNLIEGHGRLEALKALGYEKVKVIRLSHLNEHQKKAYVIAHNKLTLNTDFDTDKIASIIEELEKVDFDLSILGFEDMEIKDFFTNSQGNDCLDLDMDESPEENKKKGLVCPCCGEKALKKEFLECDIDG